MGFLKRLFKGSKRDNIVKDNNISQSKSKVSTSKNREVKKKSPDELSMIKSILSSSLNALQFIAKIKSIGFVLESESQFGDIYKSEKGLIMLTVLPSHDQNNLHTMSYSPKDGDTITLVDNCQLV